MSAWHLLFLLALKMAPTAAFFTVCMSVAVFAINRYTQED